jgi:hypothetical protein
MDLKKHFSDDTKHIIEKVTTHLSVDIVIAFGKAAQKIAYHFIQPEIDVRQSCSEKVWAGQILFTDKANPIIRI